ncbi:hypothetical protein F5Y13DRAFT_157342 [Hypoxylon sp. FL1857]|nr:hypothetical protein F5Y13DRAFT_157342 [Hypoxylon sp. FL1857]
MTVSEVVHVTVTEALEACHQTEVIIPIIHETTPPMVHETIVVPPPMVHETSVAMQHLNTTSVAPPMVHETAAASKLNNYTAPAGTAPAPVAIPPPASSLSLGYMVPHHARRWRA